MSEPKTLQEAIIYFADADNCLNFLASRRWPNGVICPTCGRKDAAFVPARRVWQCKTRHPKAQFSIKVGTIFEDSAISLDKWLMAIWMLANCKNGVSSYEVGKAIGVTQKSTWFMLQRLRLALQGEAGGKLGGEIEVDETFIGGKSRNMHKTVRERRMTGTGGKDKTAVLGILQRGGTVRTAVVRNRRKRTLDAIVESHVEPGSAVYTDTLPSYNDLSMAYRHEMVDHAIEYVRENVHTNGLENFWSLLKRPIGGTYVSVEPFHLFRYVDEQAFRFNSRIDINDSDRFDVAVRQIIGKRLTWAEVTGKVGEKPGAIN
jgi:transposase-like protein